MAIGQIYAEAESRANVFAMPRRNSINGATAANIRRSREQSKCFLLCRGVNSINGATAANIHKLVHIPIDFGEIMQVVGNKDDVQLFFYPTLVHICPYIKD